MHTLYLQSVDSRYATPEEQEAAGMSADTLPVGWRVMAHQAATIRALKDPAAPLVINQAMTGDGKSFAGQYPLFASGQKTFAMYPTNELAADQQRALNAIRPIWQTPKWAGREMDIQRIDAARIDSLDGYYESANRAQKLKVLLDSDDVLTNPDIFHLIMQFRYIQYGLSRDTLIGFLARRFDVFVFDEFHLYGAAQVASAMMAILLLREMNPHQPPRFLFLSATPQSLFTKLAERADIPVITVGGEDYKHGAASEPDEGNTHRRILRGATLHLDSGRLEDWVSAHLDDVILPFWAKHKPGAHGVIICNSVATAHRLLGRLRTPLETAGIKVGINTGLTPRAERVVDVDLLIATSTVDVGVDFRINLLIFESMDANAHIQRLGRLGRHKDDGHGNAFESYEAYALLPTWVIERIAESLPDGATVERLNYINALRDAYPAFQDFRPYIYKWAPLQAGRVITELGKREIKTQYATVHEKFKAYSKKLFPAAQKRYLEASEAKHSALLDAALSFRGSSPFTALVLDQTRPGPREIVAYNLLSLLLNAELAESSEEEMRRKAETQGQDFTALTRNNPLAYYTLVGWLDRPRQIRIEQSRIDADLNMDTITELDGFSFDVIGIPGLNTLNRALSKKQLAARLVPHEQPDALRRRLRLGLQLELFTFTTANHVEGTAAFGRHALLLDSILWQPRNPGASQDSPLVS